MARTQWVNEDAADGCMLSVPVALDAAVYWDEALPPWRCEECGQRWPGDEFACGYCGTVREDVDAP